MAIKLTGIAEHVAHNNEELIAKSLLENKTLSEVSLQTGVKYKDAITILDTDIKLQSGASCGFSASGDSKLSERIIEVAPVKVNMSWCDKDLNKIWANYKTVTRATAEELPFAEYFIADVVKNVKKANEIAYWKGDTTSTDTNLKQFDGFGKRVEREGTAVTNTKVFNATNAYSIVEAVLNAMPDEVVASDEGTIYMGIDFYRIYQQVLVSKNMYHFSGNEKGVFEIYHPGTSVRVVGREGLNGTKMIIGCQPKNLIVGCDMENDDEVFDFFYDKSDRLHKLVIEYKLGTQIAFPSEVVWTKGA